jgi:hypothetical protein
MYMSLPLYVPQQRLLYCMLVVAKAQHSGSSEHSADCYSSRSRRERADGHWPWQMVGMRRDRPQSVPVHSYTGGA